MSPNLTFTTRRGFSFMWKLRWCWFLHYPSSRPHNNRYPSRSQTFNRL